MDADSVLTHSVLYLIWFTIMGSLIGVLQFPPQPATYSLSFGALGSWSLTLDLFNIFTVFGVLIAIVTVTALIGTDVLGSGVDIDQKFTAGFAIGLYFVATIGTMLMQSMPSIHPIVSALFVYPFLFAILWAVLVKVGG